MKALPDHVAEYKTTRVFTQDTIPDALQKDHKTAADRWGVIHVLTGSLTYTIAGGETHLLTPETPKGIIEPQQPHHVRPEGPVSFYVAFHK